MDTAQNESIENTSTLNKEEKELVSWTAPGRPFKRHDRQFYTTLFAIAGIISLVLFLAEGLMPVVLIVALVFLYYVLSTVKPEDVEYKITSRGIRIAGKLIDWKSLTSFWFSERSGSQILTFGATLITGRVEVVITPEIKDSLKQEISLYLPYEEIPASGFDKVTNWVAKKLPKNK